jgi:hypothetical protein
VTDEKPTLEECKDVFLRAWEHSRGPHAKACFWNKDEQAGLAAVRDLCLAAQDNELEFIRNKNKQLEKALIRIIDCIRCDPTMDGSIRPMGLRSHALVIEALNFAKSVLEHE